MFRFFHRKYAGHTILLIVLSKLFKSLIRSFHTTLGPQFISSCSKVQAATIKSPRLYNYPQMRWEKNQKASDKSHGAENESFSSISTFIKWKLL